MTNSFLSYPGVRELILNTPKPDGNWWDVAHVSEPDEHLMFFINVDKYVKLSQEEVRAATTFVETVMMKLRADGIPCFIDKYRGVHPLDRQGT